MAQFQAVHNAVYLAGYDRGALGIPSDGMIKGWLQANGFDFVRVYFRMGAGSDPKSAQIGVIGPDGEAVATNLPFAVPLAPGKDPGKWNILVQARRAGPTGPVELPPAMSIDDLEWLAVIPPPADNSSNTPNLGGAPAPGAGPLAPAPGGAVEPASLELTLRGKLLAAAGLVGASACVYHGFRRNQSIGWALLWGLAGGVVPFIAVPIAVAQGFGEVKR